MTHTGMTHVYFRELLSLGPFNYCLTLVGRVVYSGGGGIPCSLPSSRPDSGLHVCLHFSSYDQIHLNLFSASIVRMFFCLDCETWVEELAGMGEGDGYVLGEFLQTDIIDSVLV